jgi:hypothetical protein
MFIIKSLVTGIELDKEVSRLAATNRGRNLAERLKTDVLVTSTNDSSFKCIFRRYDKSKIKSFKWNERR